MSENKSCCISAVRSSPTADISVSVSGSQENLCACLGFIVCSLLRAGVPVYKVSGAVLSGFALVGDADD